MNPGDAPVDVSVKRKRGRPRKHHTINEGVNARDYAELTHIPKHQKLNHEYQPHPVEPDNDIVDNMVGQVVSGVIEASFDAGYLLNVRVGNSETILRGVVFKPGHYVPVSIENDVAPDARMIRRNKIIPPTENHSSANGYHRNGTRHMFSDSSKGKQVSSGGNALVQPTDLSNGANQPSPVLSSVKGIHVPLLAPQAPSLSNENGAGNGSAQALHDAETKSLEMPMEVIQRGQGHSQSSVGTVMSTGKTPLQDPDAFDCVDEPLFIEPLRAVLPPHQHNHPASATRPLEKERVGRMTELLQAVQEKITGNPSPNLGS